MLYYPKDGGVCFDVDDSGCYLNWIYYKRTNFLAPFSIKGTKLRGRSHLCLPVFGKPPEHSMLHGKMSGHGWLRNMPLKLEKRDWGIHCPFKFIPSTEDAYNWSLGGFVQHRSRGNELQTEVQVWQEGTGESGSAPINIADHPYYPRWTTIDVKMDNLERNISGPIPKALKFPYTGTVTVQLSSSVRIEMEMIGNRLIEPQLVLWTDDYDYGCVELIMTHPRLFDSDGGACLKRDEEPIKVTFIKRLFV